MINTFEYDTDLGKIGLTENGMGITHLYFVKDDTTTNREQKETLLLKEAANQLYDYLAGKRFTFDLPLLPSGTDFQQKVWAALQKIPYGKTWSYKQVAEFIGNPKACRAVGMANNQNPISIFIPCHRVIGANGKLVGYGGGLPLKEQLLALELQQEKTWRN